MRQRGIVRRRIDFSITISVHLGELIPVERETFHEMSRLTECFTHSLVLADLVKEPFYRLIAANQVTAYKNPGFWACVDTMKEKKMFDDMYARADTPWAVWENSNNESKRKVLAEERNLQNTDPVKTMRTGDSAHSKSE